MVDAGFGSLMRHACCRSLSGILIPAFPAWYYKRLSFFEQRQKSVLVRKARKKRATLNPSCPKRMRRVLVAARKVGRRRVKAARRGHRQKHRQNDVVSYRKPRTVARAQHVRHCSLRGWHIVAYN